MASETWGTEVRQPRLHGILSQPLLWLGLVLLVLAGLLVVPLVIPIGPMYWDTFLYIDAAHRIASGQVPL